MRPTKTNTAAQLATLPASAIFPPPGAPLAVYPRTALLCRRPHATCEGKDFRTMSLERLEEIGSGEHGAVKIHTR